GAVVGAHHDVLDAGPEPAGPVDAGLDREGHPGLERPFVAGDDVRLLVGLEPDAVPGPVDEQVAQAGGVDDVTSRGVDARAGHPGAGPGAGGLLRGLEHLVRRESLGVDLAEGVRPGRVRAVPRGHRAADVDHDELAGPQLAAGRLVVRARAVGAAGDDD